MSNQNSDNEIYVAVVGNKGFWVYENKLLSADIDNGEINTDSAEEVDVFSLSLTEVVGLFKVLDKINGE